MIVYVVVQKAKPDSRVRGVFSTKIKAEQYIGPRHVKSTINCDSCGQKTSNPKYNPLDDWKDSLFIKKWEVK